MMVRIVCLAVLCSALMWRFVAALLLQDDATRAPDDVIAALEMVQLPTLHGNPSR